MTVTENEIFEGIHNECGKLEICTYKETGCSDCIIRTTLINAEKALEEVEQYHEIGTVEECRAAVEKQRAIGAVILNNKTWILGLT